MRRRPAATYTCRELTAANASVAQWHCCSGSGNGSSSGSGSASPAGCGARLPSSSSTATQQQQQKFQPFVLHACGIKICQGQHFHAGHLLPATVPVFLFSHFPIADAQLQFLLVLLLLLLLLFLQLAAFESHVPSSRVCCVRWASPCVRNESSAVFGQLLSLPRQSLGMFRVDWPQSGSRIRSLQKSRK